MKLGMRTIKKESCHIYHTTSIQNVPSLGPVPLGKFFCMTFEIPLRYKGTKIINKSDNSMKLLSSGNVFSINSLITSNSCFER